MKHIAGVEPGACGEVRNGRVYPTPAYAPSIYRVLLLEDGTFRVTDVLTLKDRDGSPLSGLLNPLQTAATETALDGRGRRRDPEVNGIDAEGIVRLSDGSFWIADENGPSLAHCAADGRLLVRHVPHGTEGEFAGAHYEVRAAAGDPGQAPDQSRHRVRCHLARRALSLFHDAEPACEPGHRRIPPGQELATVQDRTYDDQVVGEYVYTLDNPRTFRRDLSEKQNDLRLSELMAVGLDRLIVLERTEQTTKLYEIDLGGADNILATPWDDPATRPTLEQTDITTANIKAVPKTLRFDSADFPEMAGKTEGMALLGDGALALINDDDFGITGGRTQIVVLRGTDIARR